MTRTNRATHPTSTRRSVVGISLIEALLAVTILGFGLLAVAKFQISLSDAISAGRERVEAMMHAQDEIERLRAFNLVNNTGAGVDLGYNELTTKASAALEDSSYTAAYKRGVTIADNPVNITWAGVSNTPEMKLALINIGWTNKSGAAQTLTLPSLIAKLDPADAAWLIACQTDDNIRCGTKDVIKTPYNRNLRVPYPAKDLGGGKSAFAPPGSPNTRLVFNNDSGIIEQRCTDADTSLSNDVIDAYTECIALNGYLLSGYISAGKTNAPNVSFGDGSPISVSVSLSVGSLDQCFDDSSETIKLNSEVISYACIIIPSDTDGKPDTPATWSGISTLTGFNILQPSTPKKDKGKTDIVCRFDTNKYVGDDPVAGIAPTGTPIDNAKHPRNYVSVSSGLENQNFLIINGSSSCNYDPNPSSKTTPPSYEVQHQPQPS